MLNETEAEIILRRTQEILSKEPNLAALTLNHALNDKLKEPGMDLDRIIACIFECYAERFALAEREYTVIKDNKTGDFLKHYFLSFKEITYGLLHSHIKKLANTWKSNLTYQLEPYDLVCCINPTGIDYVTLEFSLTYNHVTTVPLSGASNYQDLSLIIQQANPKAIFAGPKDLSLVINLAKQNKEIKYIIVMNYDKRITQDYLHYQSAQADLKKHHLDIRLISLNALLTLEKNDVWEFLPPTPKDKQRIIRILYTSGSTGSPKGAIFTELNEVSHWLVNFNPFPAINLQISPFHHLMGRGLLVGTLKKGGICYFPCDNQLSSIFEDIRLVRPTAISAFPRFYEFIYTYFQQQVAKRVKTHPNDIEIIQQQVKKEIGATFLGDRLIVMEVGGAPMSPEVKQFIASCFDVFLIVAYGSTESNAVIILNDKILRRNVKEYKLRDVPALDYYSTDKPYSRGELCVKINQSIKSYYKNPEASKNLTDEEGFICTGDIVEDRGEDTVIVIDRIKDIIKLSQGEFVALGKLSNLFESHSQVIHQMYCYGNSHYSYLLAVIVPNLSVVGELLENPLDIPQLKDLIKAELQRVAHIEKIKAFELPKDFIIEIEPFSESNGLLSSLHKRLRKALSERYGERLEALYKTLETSQTEDNTSTKDFNSRQAVFDDLINLIKINLNVQTLEHSKSLTYAQLGGDSISAIALTMAIKERFGISWSADSLLSPQGSIQRWVDTIVDALKEKKDDAVTFENIHGPNAKTLKASHLNLNQLLGPVILNKAKEIPFTKETKTVLLTGANGYLGRFICLDWLRKLSAIKGKLVCIVRASSNEEAKARLDDVFIGGDNRLEQEYLSLKKDTLEVLAGDVSIENFGLDKIAYQHLAERVDRIVHSAALVSHILSYEDLFAPNVIGTLEVIRFALTHHKKSIDYISSVAIEQHLESTGHISEDSPLKLNIDLHDNYAAGYAASKWASEQLLRNASSQFGLTINIFRNNMMLAHQVYLGQINTPDFFTRLLYSVIETGLAPHSFYKNNPKTAHYDGLPVNIASACIVAVGDTYHHECRTYNVKNYNINDGCSLDAFVDWIIKAGYVIEKIDNYQEWLKSFTQALQQLDIYKQRHSILALIHGLSTPQDATRVLSNCDNFKHLIQKIKPSIELPHLDEQFILKCLNDIKAEMKSTKNS